MQYWVLICLKVVVWAIIFIIFDLILHKFLPKQATELNLLKESESLDISIVQSIIDNDQGKNYLKKQIKSIGSF